MLLNRLHPSRSSQPTDTKVRARSRLHGDGERGSAMIAVIGVMAALAIVTVTVTVMTTQSMGVTTSSRASVQARAAAEAGIDVATAVLKTTNGCTSATLSSSAPEWAATIAYDEGAGWVDGCPTAAATHIRVLSTGTAAAQGVAGVSGGDEVTIESVFAYDPVITNVPVAGSAVYAYEIQGVLKNFNLVSADNSVATSVSIKHGNVTCTNGASIGGDLLIGDGNADLDMCDVTGSVYANGNATVHKSDVGGDVRATGVVAVTGSSTVGGTVQQGPAVLPPAVPEWVDVPGDAAYWTSHGYTIVPWTSSCSISKTVAQWNNLKNHTTPTVIDFRNACPTTAITTQNNIDPVTINTDIVFIAHQFTFDKLYFNSPVDRKLTFLVADDVPGDGPTCTPPGSLNGEIRMTNESNFGSTIAAVVYTPCKIISDRDGFRGQLYGGEVQFMQQAKLTFVPVGIPGVDLSGGVTTPVQTGSTLGTRVSYRDVPAGG